MKIQKASILENLILDEMLSLKFLSKNNEIYYATVAYTFGGTYGSKNTWIQKETANKYPEKYTWSEFHSLAKWNYVVLEWTQFFLNWLW